MKIILTGATGMIGEGILIECLNDPRVQEILSVSRKPSGKSHPKLSEY
ncbi:MAG: epimerase, partial [Flavobacteriia bacterium]